MFMHATKEDTLKKVASTHGMVRWDLLKRGIQALSKSPEAYLAIRSQFARTLATFNIASYIIGMSSFCYRLHEDDPSFTCRNR